MNHHMIDAPAPRRIERLLEALGADSDFSDAVIGDLAEEFAIRAREDGPRAARRWYYRESLRVAPYLLRDWWRGLRPSDVGSLAGTVGVSAVALIVFARATRLAVHVVDPGFRSLWEMLSGFADSGLILLPALTLLWTAIDGVFGGYVAARLGRRAPLTSALALGATWAVVTAVVMVPASGFLLVVRVVKTAVLVAGIVAGGALAAARETSVDEALAADSPDGGG